MWSLRSGLIAAIGLGMLTAACNTTSSRCEDYCSYRGNCLAQHPANCQSNCEADYDDAGNSCQEAFDQVTDCVADHDLACGSCDGDVAKFLTDCFGQFR